MAYHEALWGASVGAAPVVALGYAVLLGQIRALTHTNDADLRAVTHALYQKMEEVYLSNDPSEQAKRGLQELQRQRLSLEKASSTALSSSLRLFLLVVIAMFTCGTAFLEALVSLAQNHDAMPPAAAVVILAMSFLGLLTVMVLMSYGDFLFKPDDGGSTGQGTTN
jgi:hypothetical protein